MRFNFLKLLDRILLYLFRRRLRDNVVSDDVTITTSLRSDVIILGINFLDFLVITKLLLKLFRENCGLFFSGHGVVCSIVIFIQ